MTTISDRLAEVRRGARLSLRGFVEAVLRRTGTRVLHDSARRYETGETRIPAEYIVAVCQTFAVSAEWLLLGTHPPGRRERSTIDSALDEIRAIVLRVEALEGRPPVGDALAYILDEWKRFVNRLPPKHTLREAIVSSWDRSRDAGVEPLTERTAFRVVNDADLERRRSACRAILEAAHSHIAWLSAANGGLPHVVHLVCTDGIVIEAVESHENLIDEWGLRPGTDWSEQAMGTNGAGTAIASGKITAVLGPEHFTRNAHPFTSLAAPLRDPAGTIVGALDLSTPFHGWRPHQLVFVAYAAEMLERDLAHLSG